MYEHVSLKVTERHPVYIAHLLLEENSKPFICWDIKMSQVDLLPLELVSLNTFIILTPAPPTGIYLKSPFTECNFCSTNSIKIKKYWGTG